jgi:hypothetical protein
LSGYVVTRPYRTSNVGSNLASLAGALWLAQRLERPLVVDWRGLTQLNDESLNYFTEFFDAPDEILGVPVLYAPDADVPSYGEHWTEPGEAQRLGASGRAAAPDVVALQTYHGPDRLMPGGEAERIRFLRSFYRQIRPARVIEQRIDAWSAEHLDGAFVVGVNVRTGNGHYFQKGMEYAGRVDVSVFAEGERFLRVLDRACRARLRRLPKPFRDSVRVFYATDSEQMSELLARLPNSVTRRRVFPPPGTGDTFRFAGDEYGDRDSIVDTLADMFLLARCDALVYNSSLFNQYARTVTACFGGNQAHIETLFLRGRLRQLARSVARRLG